ncbi:MAG TPA: hypothetical protein VKB88_00720 [Bryobacteraceae bacterium]|nr:hypothetical protein [Bryobacteraceae bacterium]
MPKHVSSFLTVMLGVQVVLPAIGQDPTWTKETDNRLVRVSRRNVAGRETVTCDNPAPVLLVFLTAYSVKVAGTGPNQELAGTPGGVLWHESGRLTLENLSAQPLELAEVMPTFGITPSYRLEAARPESIRLENDFMRVRRFSVRAGSKGVETRGPAVIFEFAPAHIRFTYDNGRVEETRLNAGESHFDAAGTFTFENLGDRLNVLRIELKTSRADHD